ncbi:MAG TPA: phosphoserine transaminase [Acidimicrobiales bacterium]|nr:phosphoserine transaminase [Acidimicrobiales bacterium]
MSATAETFDIRLPPELLPSDGRFGSGPSKVRPEAVAALADAGPAYLGTSHRQAPVRAVVGRVRAGLGELFGLPDGYEVALGNGGAALFWDVAVFSLIERRSQHLVFGQFSSSFAAEVRAASHLEEPDVIESPMGSHPWPRAVEGVDVYALTHNETSTGVAMPVQRPAGADPDALVVVDATSAAGGMRVDPAQFDVYYFAPQKCFGSDGGLWLALLSPAAVERTERVAASARWVPASLSLSTALTRARADETWNTPALATLYLLADQLDWLLGNGGLDWAAARSEASAAALYGWAESAPHATPFVAAPAMRSPVVGTVDLDASIDAKAVCRVLRANGIVDTEPYRSLGRNQLRVGMYPNVDPADVAILTRAIDHVVGALTA